MPLRIEDYALIGDLETAALVGRNGSIDWLCWPRFDSGACFAALLGSPDHGRWLIAPKAENLRISRCYRDGTLVLETTFEASDGAAKLIDFMPLRGAASDIVRIVVGIRGQMAFRTELVIRFDYGACVPWVSRTDDGTLRAIVGPDMLALRTPVETHGENLKTVGEFSVSAGQAVPFVLTYTSSHLQVPAAIDPDAALSQTEAGWRAWSGRCETAGEWSAIVSRSLMTLKALTYAPTGGVLAAPTTSLPERLGGMRNWDYRFCWLRDATMTLLALMGAGYYEEARAWRDWLLRAVAGSPAQMQIMYGIGGERRLTEWEVPWLPGYEGARPVRIGNAAHTQLQLDVYGEVMDAMHVARGGKISATEAGWAMQRALLAHLETVWQQPDEGLWETRGHRQHFTYSKVMTWVAVDRAVKDAERYQLGGPLDRWRALRQQIHDDVCRNGYDAEIGSFVQAYGSTQIDASLLLLPTIGFLPPTDPRVRGTVAAVERYLSVDGFVLRYNTEKVEDGLPPGEGTFLACSFWLADAYILQGRRDDARRLFERLLGLCNDVGLLAEEYDVSGRRMLGNFPQAFSHVALVNTAYNLTKADAPAKQRAEAPAPA
jgi:GH15 family glucan-1,4-alpha-glucosidase